MKARHASKFIAGLFGIGLAMFAVGPAFSDDDDEDHDPHKKHAHVCPHCKHRFVDAAQRAISQPNSETYKLSNFTATLEPGEPTVGGLMTRTIWAGFKSPIAQRVVIHTYGSEIDTVLAAYRGTDFTNMVRVAYNDNTPIPGVSSTHSLIQFDAAAGQDYRIQIGSRNLAEGNVSLNVFGFPTTAGGLSAFMFSYGGSRLNGRDYVCELFPVGTLPCPNAGMIVHNSTGQTLTVTPSTTLGPGVSAGAPFTLAPRALKVVTFRFNAGFDHTTVRTVSGQFILTGRSGNTIVSEARHRATLVVGKQSLNPDLIRAVVSPAIQTGHVNRPVTFDAKITNIGAETAIGCHIRSNLYSYLKTSFYRVDPVTGVQIGADNAPTNIAPGQSQSFKVIVASQAARDADFIDAEAGAHCANSYRAQQSLLGGFDISATGYTASFPSVQLQSSTPANGILTVPVSGFAYYRLRTINTSTAQQLNVLPAYLRPFDDPPNTAFTTAICQTNPVTGACLAPYASSVSYLAVKNQPATFSVRVAAGAAAPAFDPDQRRILVNFKLADVPYFHIAAPSIAVRRQ